MIVDRNTEYDSRPQPNGSDLLRAVQLAIESGRDFHGLPLLELREYLLRAQPIAPISETPRVDALIAKHQVERDMQLSRPRYGLSDRNFEMASRQCAEITFMARELEKEWIILHTQLRHCEQAKRITEDKNFGLEQLRPKYEDRK